ncbi:hypothetical protein ACFX1R_010304 [Malus domestica]
MINLLRCFVTTKKHYTSLRTQSFMNVRSTLRLTVIWYEKQIHEGMIRTAHIRTTNQTADLFTKALNSPQFGALLAKLGVINIQSNLRGSVEDNSKK